MSWRNDIFHLQPDEDYSIAQRRATLSSMNVAVALRRVSILIDFRGHALDFVAVIVFDGPILTSQFLPSNSAADVHFIFSFVGVIMRIVFVGAVESSKIALEALIKAGRPPALVITLPPEAAGRHSDFVDLGNLALAAGSAVHHTTDINALETLEAVTAVAPDLTLVIGWSQVCRRPFREIARVGTAGFHPAALPRLRGRGVIPWTILRGEEKTGSTLFWLDDGVDSGPILLQRQFPVDPDETARSLYTKHTENLAQMIVEAAAQVEAGNAARAEQNQAEASYCAKRTAEDGLIDWRQSAASILRLIRAVGAPYPGAFTFYNGQKIRIDAAVPVENSRRFIGLTGQIQAITERGFIVLCGDAECIEATSWEWAPERRPPIHAKLGGTAA
ncbi:methionyl-tRNA formyltransferase [Sinorhizobium medicae]